MRGVRVALLIVVGMVLTISTAMRVHVFRDERLIWQDAASKAPEKPRPWINLGRQYALLGGHSLARWSYEQAIELAAAPERPVREGPYPSTTRAITCPVNQTISQASYGDSRHDAPIR